MKPQYIYISKSGGKYYYSDKDMKVYHREDGPAIEYADGSKYWYREGKYHREDGPSVEWACGHKFWYHNDKLHREDGPAVEWKNGDKEWSREGKLHREDGPAIESHDGTKCWFIDGVKLTETEFDDRKAFRIIYMKPQYIRTNEAGNKYYYSDKEMKVLHREDGPAVESSGGTKIWYRDGLVHRADGPAIEFNTGSKAWYRYGKRHREDGPAFEYRDGTKYWYIDDVQITEDEFDD